MILIDITPLSLKLYISFPGSRLFCLILSRHPDLQEGKEEVLGTGMAGAVLVAKHRKSGRRVAAKCLEVSDGALPEEAGYSTHFPPRFLLYKICNIYILIIYLVTYLELDHL